MFAILPLKEFFIKTNLEQFKTNAGNLEAIHFKSQISADNSKIREEIVQYLDL